ncbi:MAG TPA: methyl-accepting chemotaxis protein [Cerasibacillus sp.]|uniref:methyl-accepting chemotaxis protein n=1 Tax=Cerasibacillus sp. TaxID=2498711 RepID=UPI002F3FEF49
MAKRKRQGNKINVNFLKWNNYSIGRKYVTVFFLTAFFFMVAGVIVFIQMFQGNKSLEDVEITSSLVSDMSEMAAIIQTKDVQISDFLLTNSKRYIEAFEQYQAELDQLTKKIKPQLQTKTQQTTFHNIVENDARVNEIFFDEVLKYVEMKSDYMAMSTRNQTSELRAHTIQLVNELMDLVKKEEAQSVSSAKRNLTVSTIVLVIAIPTVVIIGVVLMIYVSRKISSHLRQVVGITSEIAKGNLAVSDMDYEGNDEIGQLTQALNQMKGNMTGILSKVASASNVITSRSNELNQSANDIREGSEQIATTMEELSSGAETQADSTSGLAEKMTDFVQKVTISEENGTEIKVNSKHMLQLTNEGTTLMNQSVKQMNRIDTIVSESVKKVQSLDEQSNQISNLVSVIKDISEQTNLLSLNAAIEAARAGEHGRGFAVVADEVRKLSDQVAESVSEITNIVNNIQHETDDVVHSLHQGYDEVKSGTNQIEETGKKFQVIHSSITDMVERISIISNHLQDMSITSDDMNRLISDIAAISEESAAGVEQAAASAQQSSSAMEEITRSASELSDLAKQLQGELKVFKFVSFFDQSD